MCVVLERQAFQRHRKACAEILSLRIERNALLARDAPHPGNPLRAGPFSARGLLERARHPLHGLTFLRGC